MGAMLRTRVIPCLLLKNAGLVKTVKFKNSTYVGDPINAVKIFNDSGVDELVFLDITATIDKKEPDYRRIGEIAGECFMPLAYGGGIRSIESIRKIFALGIEKVIINSYALENRHFINQAASVYGNQSIVVAMDVKRSILGKYEIFSYNGTKNMHVDAIDHAKQMEAFGAGESFVHSIDRDGTMKGFDLELIGKIGPAVRVPVIACGGAGKTEDLKKAVEAGASAVCAGSLFVFHGPHRAVLINFPTEAELEKILPRT
jgi:cyclase